MACLPTLIFQGLLNFRDVPPGLLLRVSQSNFLTLQWMRFDPGICQNSAGNCGKCWDRNGYCYKKKNLGVTHPQLNMLKSTLKWTGKSLFYPEYRFRMLRLQKNPRLLIRGTTYELPKMRCCEKWCSRSGSLSTLLPSSGC